MGNLLKNKYIPGNIDLTKRPVVMNEDGSISTVKSMSFNIDGKEVLVPTIGDKGERYTNRQAIDNYLKTGKHLGKFNTINQADTYAQQLHLNQQEQYRLRPITKDYRTNSSTANNLWNNGLNLFKPLP